MVTLTHDQWRVWTPIGSWYFNTDYLSEKKNAEQVCRITS